MFCFVFNYMWLGFVLFCCCWVVFFVFLGGLFVVGFLFGFFWGRGFLYRNSPCHSGSVSDTSIDMIADLALP